MAMTREELIDWATRNGWKLDRWGHLKREFSNSTYRLKLSRIAARYEVETPDGWVRIASGYFKNMRITPNNQIAGMTR